MSRKGSCRQSLFLYSLLWRELLSQVLTFWYGMSASVEVKINVLLFATCSGNKVKCVIIKPVISGSLTITGSVCHHHIFGPETFETVEQ